MRMRVADYLTNELYEAGGAHVFLITGGMIMHLTDALLRHGRQKYVCCHHEQAAVMAADTYGRLTNRLGVAYVTAGPGALNAMTGVVGAYVDTAPCIIVSGQSKVSQAIVTGPRQFAMQGFNTLPLYKQVTKYAVMLQDIRRVRYEVEKCIWMATTPRVGPVWIECPIDIQAAMFDPEEHEPFVPPPCLGKDWPDLDAKLDRVVDAIKASRRPVILAGAGVRLSGAVPELLGFAENAGIPVLTSRLGMDLIGEDHPLFAGRPGTYGDRPANFTVQNCDLLLSIGCRLGIGLVGYDFQDFACHALKIMVDVDEQELIKPSVVPDIPVLADAGLFIKRCGCRLGSYRLNNAAWRDQVRLWRKNYPVDLPEYEHEKDGINSYHFTRLLSERMPEDAVIVCDTGSCFHVHAQAFKVRYGQRHIITGGLSTMGYMPGVIGAAAGVGTHDVYCITGDGSLQMNIQELQTLVHNKYRAKLIVHSNNGYLLIRHTQKNFQEGRYIGTHAETGVSFPDLEKLSKAYGIHYLRISTQSECDAKIKELLNYQDGPVICEVISPPEQLLIPRVASRKRDDGSMASMPYDDMYPFLTREEYAVNCVREKIL
jgi:acetolactate synthase I/II/III large subunit